MTAPFLSRNTTDGYNWKTRMDAASFTQVNAAVSTTTGQKDACCTLWSITPTVVARSLTPNARRSNDSPSESVKFVNSCYWYQHYMTSGANGEKREKTPVDSKRNQRNCTTSRRKRVSNSNTGRKLFLYLLLKKRVFQIDGPMRPSMSMYIIKTFWTNQSHFQKNWIIIHALYAERIKNSETSVINIIYLETFK